MNGWECRCRNGKKLRAAISDDDMVGVLLALIDCYNEIASNYCTDDDDFAEECAFYVEEINDLFKYDTLEEDDVNYELNEFYDFCDNLNIWIEL